MIVIGTVPVRCPQCSEELVVPVQVQSVYINYELSDPSVDVAFALQSVTHVCQNTHEKAKVKSSSGKNWQDG